MPPPPGLPPLNGEVEQHVERVRQGHATWRSTDEGTPIVGDQVTVVLAHAGSRNDALGDEDADRAYDFLVGSDQALPGIQNAVQTPDRRSGGRVRRGVSRRRRRGAGRGQIDPGSLDREADARAAGAERRPCPLGGRLRHAEELRTTIRKEMEAIHRGMVERNRDEQLVRMLVEANDFDVPASFVDQVANAMIDDVVRASDGEPNAPTEADMERLRKEVRGACRVHHQARAYSGAAGRGPRPRSVGGRAGRRGGGDRGAGWRVAGGGLLSASARQARSTTFSGS